MKTQAFLALVAGILAVHTAVLYFVVSGSSSGSEEEKKSPALDLPQTLPSSRDADPSAAGRTLSTAEGKNAAESGGATRQKLRSETAAETVAERPSKSPALTPAEWQYPDDCFYIKMYILAPLAKMVEAFGPKHRYGDEKRRAGDGVRGKARSAASGRSRSRARRRTRRSISSKCAGMGEIDARGCTISDTSS